LIVRDSVWRGELPPDYDPRPFIAAQRWTYAKTMPWHPHEHLLIFRATSVIEHITFLLWIRRSEHVETYNGREYRYREVDGMRYWALGPNDTIINRRAAPTPDDPHPPLPWQTAPIPEPPAVYEQPKLI
jgi:hypothetical protein